MSVWEITSRESTPTMYCAHVPDISNAAARKAIKALLQRAKESGTSIHAIQVSIDEEGTTATLMGTERT